MCLCVSLRSYPPVAPVIVPWLRTRCTRNLQPFWQVATRQFFGPFSPMSVFYLGNVMHLPGWAQRSICVYRDVQSLRPASGLDGKQPLRDT